MASPQRCVEWRVEHGRVNGVPTVWLTRFIDGRRVSASRIEPNLARDLASQLNSHADKAINLGLGANAA